MLQISKTAKSGRRGHQNHTNDRATITSKRNESSFRAERLQVTTLSVPGARAVLPQGIRLPIKEDTRAEQMNATLHNLGKVTRRPHRSSQPSHEVSMLDQTFKHQSYDLCLRYFMTIGGTEWKFSYSDGIF